MSNLPLEHMQNMHTSVCVCVYWNSSASVTMGKTPLAYKAGPELLLFVSTIGNNMLMPLSP